MASPNAPTTQQDQSSNDPIFPSVRLLVALTGGVCLLMAYLMLYQMSFVITCMVIDSPATNSSGEAQTCYVPARIRHNGTWDRARSEAEPGEEPYGEGKGEFIWSPTEKGVVLSGFFVGFATALLAGGYLSDQFGGKWPMTLGVGVGGLLGMGCPQAARSHFIALTFTRICQGLCAGVILPGFTAIMAKWASPSERTVLMGYAWLGVPGAMVVLYPLSSALCQNPVDNGWPLVFYVTGAMCIGLTPLIYLFVSEWPASHRWMSEKELRYLEANVVSRNKEKLITPWKTLLTAPPTLAFIAGYMAQMTGWTFACGFTPLFMKDVLKFDMSESGDFSIVPFLSMIVVRFLLSTFFHPVRSYLNVPIDVARKTCHAIGILIPSAALVAFEWVDCSQQLVGVSLLVVNVAMQDFAFSAGYGFTNGDFAPAYAGLIAGVSLAIGTVFTTFFPLIVTTVTSHHTHDEWMKVLYIVVAVNLFGMVMFNRLGSSQLQPWGRGVLKDGPRE